MPRPAWLYVGTVITLGIALVWWAVATGAPLNAQWVPFLVLVGLALLTEYYRTLGVNNVSHSATAILEFAGLLLLHPAHFVLLVALPLLFTWLRAGVREHEVLRQWYKPLFNLSMTLFAAFAALLWGNFVLGRPLDPGVVSTSMVAAIVGAAFVMVSLHHVLLQGVVTLASGRPLRDVARIDQGIVLTDFVLFLVGYIAAILWTLNPVLALLSFAPLFLIFRALRVPHLEKEAHTDSKTGLINAHHFLELAAVEFERAGTRQRPMALLMADLDLLRDINNTYGHLAGDTVIAGVADVIRETVRMRDIASRFGGEEYAILLPDVTPVEAEAIAWRLCHAVEATGFLVETSRAPIHVTMSIGVAHYPRDAATVQQLLHEADTAAYHAKAQGRNRVITSVSVPTAFRLAERAAERSADPAPTPAPHTRPEPQVEPQTL
jgi:diguanylate cyclase (GGDEF)-like protein